MTETLYLVYLSAKWEQPDYLNTAAHWLGEEWTALERLKNPRIQQTKRRQKSAMCHLLQQFTPNPKLGKQDSGKPFLINKPNLHFNLSHSGDWLALLTSDCGPVGVDLEAPQKVRNFKQIAQHFFAPEEIEHLAPLEGQLLTSEFYRLWTLKEAFFKARGTGISEGLRHINFTHTHVPTSSAGLPVEPWQFKHHHIKANSYGPSQPSALFLATVIPSNGALSAPTLILD